jgi:hypothetical protein
VEGRFEALSRICRFVVSSQGTLQVVLLGPRLTFADLVFLLGHLDIAGTSGDLRRVTIDFEAIQEIVNPWTAVLALLIQFRARSTFACQVCNLRGQPANIFSLYRRSQDLMRLVSGGASVAEKPALRRAG